MSSKRHWQKNLCYFIENPKIELLELLVKSMKSLEIARARTILCNFRVSSKARKKGLEGQLCTIPRLFVEQGKRVREDISA